MYEYKCPKCESDFKSEHKPRIYCSLKCAADARNDRVRAKPTKICNTCKIEKEKSEFQIKSVERGLHHFECRKCNSERMKNRPAEWKEKEKLRSRKKARIKRGVNPDFEGKYLNHPNGRNINLRWKNAGGYIQIYRPGHPNARATDLICEHVWIMSEHIKRPLRKGETVHHKNGIRDDNRIENLELWHSGHPSGQRVDDKIKWCIEFLNEYGYDVTER